MRPPVVKPGSSVTFTNFDALPEMSDNDQAWHTHHVVLGTVQPRLGHRVPARQRASSSSTPASSATASFTSSEVTTGSNVYTTPPLTKAGNTYTYFCRIHPFMRGSIRVAGKSKGGPKHLVKG